MGDKITITEVLLRTRVNGVEQGLFSHASESVVRHKRDSLIVDALNAGVEPPEMELVRRVCTYPAGAKGKPQAAGSTCDETIIPD